MKKYFQKTDSENCYTKGFFDAIMKLNKVSEMEVFEAKAEHGTGYFWCSEFLEVGEVGESCGLICKDYKPRNGKNGRCVHSSSPYGNGKKVTLKLRQ